MRILVTGGTGFIGARLAVIASESHHGVLVTGLGSQSVERQRRDSLEAAGIAVRLGSILDPAFLASITRNCDVVVHLAAAQHEMNVPDEHFCRVNVDGTRMVLEAALANGVRRFVYGSTIGVYGPGSENLLDEQSPVRPENIYDRTKWQAEELVRTYSQRIETVIVRISEVYGPGDFRLLKLFRAIKDRRFVMLGPGRNERQAVYVDDLAKGLLLATTRAQAAGQTYLLAGREVLTTSEVIAQIAKVLDVPAPRLSVPLWPFVPAALLVEHTLRPLGIQPPLHGRRLDFFRKSYRFSIDRSVRELGFDPSVSFAEGAGSTARWYAEEGLLGPVMARAPVASTSDGRA